MGEGRVHEGGLREVARNAARRRLADVAVDLFAERGFDAVTIDQIAESAGISTRSVHRYFATKEDMVIGPFEANVEVILELLRCRPSDEPPMQSLHAAIAGLVERTPARPRDKVAMRLLAGTPSVRARNGQKQFQWTELMGPLIAGRLDGRDASLRANVLVQACLAAFTVALVAWADDPAGRPLAQLVDIAFDGLRR